MDRLIKQTVMIQLLHPRGFADRRRRASLRSILQGHDWTMRECATFGHLIMLVLAITACLNARHNAGQ